MKSFKIYKELIFKKFNYKLTFKEFDKIKKYSLKMNIIPDKYLNINCEKCKESYLCINCKDCYNCFKCNNCNNCKSSCNLKNCYKCYDCNDCNKCNKCTSYVYCHNINNYDNEWNTRLEFKN